MSILDCPVNLVKEKIETHNDFGNAISNTVQLITEYQKYLELKDIYRYDRMDMIQTPSSAVVFNNGVPQSKSLGSACNAMVIKLIVYLYLETLTPGMDTYSHVCRLSSMVRMFYDHSNLYGLCASQRLNVDDSQLIGRRLNSEVYLAGQIDLTIPTRFCKCEECSDD